MAIRTSVVVHQLLTCDICGKQTQRVMEFTEDQIPADGVAWQQQLPDGWMYSMSSRSVSAGFGTVPVSSIVCSKTCSIEEYRRDLERLYP